MNHIKRTITILGITTIFGGIPVVNAQAPQTRINQMNFQEYYNQGVQKLEQGNFNGAMSDDKPLRVYADFNQVVELNPQYYEGFCLRGLAKSQTGNWKSAIVDFNKALQLNPNHADAYKSRGTVHASLGNLDKAMSDFNQTIKIDPKSIDGYYNRGLAYLKQKNPQAAIKDFNQTLSLNPNLADAYGNRGLAQYALGDSKSALADLQQAARLFLQQGNTQGYQQTQALIQQVQQ